MSKQFSDLGIESPILKSLTELKIVTPTEIQQKTIPLLLQNKTDLVGPQKQVLVNSRVWITTFTIN